MTGSRIPHLPARVQRLVDEAVHAAARTAEPLAEPGIPHHAGSLRRGYRLQLVSRQLDCDDHRLRLVAKPVDEEPERLGAEGVRVLAPARHPERELACAQRVPAGDPRAAHDLVVLCTSDSETTLCPPPRSRVLVPERLLG